MRALVGLHCSYQKEPDLGTWVPLRAYVLHHRSRQLAGCPTGALHRRSRWQRPTTNCRMSDLEFSNMRVLVYKRKGVHLYRYLSAKDRSRIQVRDGRRQPFNSRVLFGKSQPTLGPPKTLEAIILYGPEATRTPKVCELMTF